MEYHRINDFGDPFSTMRDPLLHELNGSSSSYFSSPNSTNDHHLIIIEYTSSFSASGHDDTTSPCNIFSRVQISHGHNSSPRPVQPPPPPCYPQVMSAACVSPRGHKAPAVLPSGMLNVNTSKGCLIDNTTASVPVQQISSPRNLGIKRRNSQAKKVVCIPAPAAANSRSSGEVVPSDLWAWRKYGQKPIKGSPYPRGYYRCSSSKGCSARKQVERSRTDPNMLVITYTSEHNHPWPTQINALAGSTRSQSQPSKAHASSTSSGPKIDSPSNSQAQNTAKETNSNNDTKSTPVKEEIPVMPKSQQQTEDFFADLDELELETDTLNLLFGGRETEDEVLNENKAIDPLLFDYNNNASF